MDYEIITSIQNNYIKKVTSLKTSKGRKKTGLFIVEGYKSIVELNDTWKVETIIYSEEYLEKNGSTVDELKNNYKTLLVDNKVFNHISDTSTPQGILAVVVQNEMELEDMLNTPNPFIILIEGLQDPGNLGTIIRTADAAGADGIVLSKDSVDLYNPKIVRATMGSMFHLPVIAKYDIDEAISVLKNRNIKVYAAHLKGAKYPYEEDFTKGAAILIGNEGSGLSDEIASLADTYVKLPMLGKAESLNAAVAASILTYEVVRQRLVHDK